MSKRHADQIEVNSESCKLKRLESILSPKIRIGSFWAPSDCFDMNRHLGKTTNNDNKSIAHKRPMAICLPRFNLSFSQEMPNSVLRSPLADQTLSFKDCGAVLSFKSNIISTSGSSKTFPSDSMSMSDGPSNILPFLFLGSQNDAMTESTIKRLGITHILNVTSNCAQSTHVSEANFLRIPVNDSPSDRLLPHFDEAFRFLDAACDSNCSVLVHCLAGISRSATVVVAYLMYRLKMSNDEAYEFVKSKRPTISPNFNFLGQLVEFESNLQSKSKVPARDGSLSTLTPSEVKLLQSVHLLSENTSSLSSGSTSAESSLIQSPIKSRDWITPDKDCLSSTLLNSCLAIADVSRVYSIDDMLFQERRMSRTEKSSVDEVNFLDLVDVDAGFGCLKSGNQSSGSLSSIGSHGSLEIVQVS